MSPSEISDLLMLVEKRWPYAPLPLGSADVWLDDLADVPFQIAAAALKQWARAGEKFPPTSGWVMSECERAAGAALPSFDEAADVTRWIPTRAFIRELYQPEGHYSPDVTARAVELMMENGAHEAACRFVQERGLRAVVTIPSGERHGLDLNQQADRRDAARHFRDVTVPGWRADPRPGLALERARSALESGRRGELRPVDPGRYLPEVS